MLGIPTLLNKPLKAAAISLIGNAVNMAYDFLFSAPICGIYPAGESNLVAQFSSVVELEITGEAMASDFPVETGAFTTYNKVLHPNIFVLRFTQDGNTSQKASLLQWCEVNVESTSLFDVVCPEKVWGNATLIRYRNLRSAESGAGMITVECVFQQIRELPAKYTNSKTASPKNESTGQTTRVNAVSENTVTDRDFGAA